MRVILLKDVKNLGKKNEMLEGGTKEKGRLKKTTLEYTLRTGEKGEPFGSVSRHEIEESLNKKGFSSIHIKLEKPLKTLGRHEVEVDLGGGVRARLNVEVNANK